MLSPTSSNKSDATYRDINPQTPAQEFEQITNVLSSQGNNTNDINIINNDISNSSIFEDFAPKIDEIHKEHSVLPGVVPSSSPPQQQQPDGYGVISNFDTLTPDGSDKYDYFVTHVSLFW